MAIYTRLTTFVLAALLTGCGGGLEDMSDADLQQKIFECAKPEQSPGMAISCDNYRRECSRRREQGRFVC